MIKIVLLRHGESVWNKENKFTGWTDVDLSEKGIEESINAGHILKNNNFDFDVAFTSVLKRAIHTLDYVLDILNLENIVIYRHWRLNERHYGALQGLNKDEVSKQVGPEQMKLWRRGVYNRPPLLTKDDPRYPGNDPVYKDLTEDELPLSESLDDANKRFLYFYNEVMQPVLLSGKRAIVVAHHNSLRAFVKYLDNLSDEEIVEVEIPTGVPLIYELDDDLNTIRHYYLEK